MNIPLSCLRSCWLTIGVPFHFRLLLAASMKLWHSPIIRRHGLFWGHLNSYSLREGSLRLKRGPLFSQYPPNSQWPVSCRAYVGRLSLDSKPVASQSDESSLNKVFFEDLSALISAWDGILSLKQFSAFKSDAIETLALVLRRGFPTLRATKPGKGFT